jgi:mannosyl-oligosaccharide glucosidase
MAPNSRRKSNFLKGLLPLLLTQLPLVGAQVAAIEKASNESLLWGPYRPNLYFGVRPRIPKSLMGGLLWTRVEDHTVQNSKSKNYAPMQFDCGRRLRALHPMLT